MASPYNYGSYAAQGKAYQNARRRTPTNTSLGNKPAGTASTVAGTTLPWYMNPSANARKDTEYSWADRYDASRTLSPADQAGISLALRGGIPPNQPPTNPLAPGSGRSGGGGGGGGGAVGGLDQATLDWLFGQMGAGKPQNLSYNPLDLPDPRQFLGNFDTSQFDLAGQGVTQGIQGIRERGNTAFDQALGELNRYQNPYAGGLQQVNPDYAGRFGAMAAANDAGGQLQQTVGEGAQADRAMANAYALMAGNDQARQAANLRGVEGDRRTMEQNLGLEGNLLGLGVNMARAKGQSAWEQMVRQAQLDAANQETATNWTRGNTVGDTNVANRNAWNSGLMQTLLQIIGAKAPGTTLPTDTGGWYV